MLKALRELFLGPPEAIVHPEYPYVPRTRTWKEEFVEDEEVWYEKENIGKYVMRRYYNWLHERKVIFERHELERKNAEEE